MLFITTLFRITVWALYYMPFKEFCNVVELIQSAIKFGMNRFVASRMG
jgi:hypothetical protein